MKKIFLPPVCAVLAIILLLTAYAPLKPAYALTVNSGSKYEELQRLINGESDIFSEFHGGLKANESKVRSTDGYYNGGEVFKYSDGLRQNLNLFFETYNLGERYFSGVSATEGDFFGIRIGEDNMKDVAAVLGSAYLFEEASDMTDLPFYVYYRPGGRLTINCNAEYTIVDISLKVSYKPTYSSSGRFETEGLTDNYNYTFDNGGKNSYKGEILLMSHGLFLSKYSVVMQNDRAFVSIAAIEAVTGAVALYNSEKDEITITKGDISVSAKMNSSSIIVTSAGKTEQIQVDAYPFIQGRYDQTVYVPLRAFAEVFNKKVGYIPAAPEYKTPDFYEYPDSKTGIAYNPVIWVDDPAYMDNNGKTSDEMLTWLKDFMTEKLDDYKSQAGEMEEWFTEPAILELIQRNIDNTVYLGQAGRYAFFKGPYLTLVDYYTNSVYFYCYGHAYGGLINVSAPSKGDQPAFISMYFTD